jgi:uncharacterized repeat protein (TIGR03803 family)
MKTSKLLKHLSFWAAANCLLLAYPAFASRETVLHSFTDNPDGAHPMYSLVFDRSGNLYGTTPNGGSAFEGDIFKLSPDGSGGWTYGVIYTFTNCSPGCYPQGPLTLDDAGNLYGAASTGGTNNTGIVFQLTRKHDGTWSARALYSFGPDGNGDGSSPNGVVYFKGGLYGTTSNGGKHGGGIVFSLTRTSDGAWSETVLHDFQVNNVDGNGPMGGVTLDAEGNVYGTTSMGGPSLAGTVFELTRDREGTWSEHILHSFNVTDGNMPWFGSLIFDKDGNIYGTTSGGGSGKYGTVFKLTRSGKDWTETVLHNFAGGQDGAGPNAGVTLDLQGRLYGTTFEGGGRGDCTNPPSTVNQYCGTAFLLTPSLSGSWTESFLHRFASSTDGGEPSAGLVLESNDNAYGLASQGGTSSYGVVFVLSRHSK